jgi:hypothetical protein
MDHSVVFVALSVLATLCFRFSRLQKGSSSSTVPLSGEDGIFARFKFFSDAKLWLWNGIQQYPGKMFRFWTPNGYLHVAAHDQLPELNKLGDDQLRVAFGDKVNPTTLFVYKWSIGADDCSYCASTPKWLYLLPVLQH